MAEIEVPKNTAAVFVGKTLREVIDDAIPVAEASIEAAAPFMATPVFEQVWEEIFKLSMDALGKALGDAGSFVVIDIQRYQQLVDITKATRDLKAAQAAGDSDGIAKAKAAADAAANSLLHYGGDAHS